MTMPVMRNTARLIALLLALLPAAAPAQIYLPPNVGLPPQSVIGNALPQTGNAVAVTFTQLRSAMNVPAIKTCSSHQWFNSLASGGVLGCSQPSISDISGFGTGGAAALAINVGSPGSFVVNGGALGTPSSGSLVNATGLPILTGVSGLGSSIATALSTNVGSAGAPVTNGGALGTPSSGTATNLTGLPIATGVSGLGTGVATWAATPSSANLRAALTDETGTGLAYFQGGDIGTPSAGVGTNLTALNGTQLTSGTIPAARTNGHQNGTATNDNANAGEVGEYSESSITSPISLTTGTAINLTSLSLTAGDWDVDCWGQFNPAGTTTVNFITTSLSLTTGTLDVTTNGRWVQNAFNGGVPNAAIIAPVPKHRFSLSATTTVFCVVRASFGTSTMNVVGIMRARRAR